MEARPARQQLSWMPGSARLLRFSPRQSGARDGSRSTRFRDSQGRCLTTDLDDAHLDVDEYQYHGSAHIPIMQETVDKLRDRDEVRYVDYEQLVVDEIQEGPLCFIEGNVFQSIVLCVIAIN